MALVDLIRGKGKAAVGGLAGVLQAANSANPMEQNTYGQPIPPTPKWANFLLNSGNAIANAVMAPSNALAGKYDQIVVGPDGKVLSMIDPRMMDDAATLSGLLTTGAMPIPKPAGSLGMGGGKMANPAFKEWFGGSKVVDDAGGPLVVYHGTRAEDPISAFSIARAGSRTDPGYLGKGVYFSDKPNVASIYAGDGTVYPVNLALKNPLTLTARMEGRREVDRAVLVREALGLDAKASAQDVTDAAKAAGYDGVIYVDPFGGREFTAFDPEQIKSAIGNRGTFDPNDPNILRAGGIPMIPMPTDQKDQQ